jgi:release factor glutamine methyltransferase
VAPGVFVPRRRSELLVAVARRDPGDVVVDLCCGTGALGAALAAEWPWAEVYAADSDPSAVACARRNLPPERVFAGDLYAALPDELRGRVEVLVVNAPYVPTRAIATMPPEAREHEHREALDGGHDGLEVQRRVVAGATGWLAPGGRLLLETSRGQAEQTEALVVSAGLAACVETDDDLGGTVVVGRGCAGWCASYRFGPPASVWQNDRAESACAGPSHPELRSPPRRTPVSPRGA